jgi:alkanesulfonate monooxygenase SsuD/methylene tetrahydromethanopterin reductase-like flavin-dependent oxidoreductase (luciferase family)
MPLLEERLGHSLAGYDLDGPLPDLPISDQLRSRAELLTELAKREKLTIRQLALRVAAGRGHHMLVGTPVEIADRMQQWFEAGAADGFNVMPPFFPQGLEDFTQLIVPILQERGLFRVGTVDSWDSQSCIDVIQDCRWRQSWVFLIV